MKSKVKCDFCKKKILRYPTKTNTYFCNIGCKSKWQTLQREKLGYTKEWLINEYFNKNKTCNDIAREINRDPKRVWDWFKQYGIEVKRRGQDERQHFKKGHKGGVGRAHKKETKEKIRQARIKDGHVPYLKNGIHWLHHENAVPPTWKGGITAERQGFYSSLEWKECIKAIWKRDNATCQRCKKHQNENKSDKFHIHHIVSFEIKELRAEVSNLILLCRTCHLFVHSKKNINQLFIKKWHK
jgi:transposase-like protein